MNVLVVCVASATAVLSHAIRAAAWTAPGRGLTWRYAEGEQGRAPSRTVTVAPSDEATGALPGTGPCSPPGGVRCGAHGVRPPSYFEFHEATAGTTAVSVDTVLSILRAGRKEPREFRLRSSLRLRQPKRLVGVALGQSAQVEGAR